uniref:Putative molecular chaperone n=1 Tax=uncultured bacterium contig00030 TaxID=1181519 RepID=A0A806KQ99_9BACT|nr:putative molecular chaperone [uncultured bacterium contig00030]
MNLLAIDTAHSFLSVAVSKNDEIFCERTDAAMSHSQLIMLLIDEQMKKAALAPSDLDGVLCMGGPGSFTGLRIGYSAAKALSLSLSIPFVPVPTLDCIAHSFRNDSRLLIPVIQTNKNAWVFSIFKGNERLAPDQELSVDKFSELINEKFKNNEKITIAGPGAQQLYDGLAQEYRKLLEVSRVNANLAKELISIAKNKNLLHNYTDAHLYSGPEYIRMSDAEAALGGA